VRTIDPADVLALLEEGPTLQGELVAYLGVGVPKVLQMMRRQCQVKRLLDGRWALVDYAAAPVESEVETADVDTAPRRLRQPIERPPSATVKSDLAPSWWVNKSREEFSEEARKRHAAMRESKMNRYVQDRMLQ
jgi:hypothetical protein